jgi:hypothetical protein
MVSGLKRFFGRRLAALREAKSLQQHQLRRLVGKKDRHIRAIETGKGLDASLRGAMPNSYRQSNECSPLSSIHRKTVAIVLIRFALNTLPGTETFPAA